MRKLTGSLTELKGNQSQTFATLPEPQLYRGDAEYTDCHSLEDLFALNEDVQKLPVVTLLRCSIEEISAKNDATTDATIFESLGNRWPWLQSEEGSAYMVTSLFLQFTVS